MTMHKVFHSRDDIYRLYVLKKGRGFSSIKNCTDTTILELDKYNKKGKERLIASANSSNVNIKTNRKTTKSRKQKLEEQQPYGYLKWQTWDIAYEMTLTWLRIWNVKKGTESLIIVAYNNAIKQITSKQKLLICNRIANVGYVETEMK